MADMPTAGFVAREEVSEMLEAPKANPLLDRAGRQKLEEECLRLVEEESKATGQDGTEVIAAASEWRGTVVFNPSSMSDDRLLHTVRALRRSRMARSEPEPQTSAPDIDELARAFVGWLVANQREGELLFDARQRFLAEVGRTLTEYERAAMVQATRRYL
jgi:hypothetical protein